MIPTSILVIAPMENSPTLLETVVIGTQRTFLILHNVVLTTVILSLRPMSVARVVEEPNAKTQTS
jgi:hypothetical protein